MVDREALRRQETRQNSGETRSYYLLCLSVPGQRITLAEAEAEAEAEAKMEVGANREEVK